MAVVVELSGDEAELLRSMQKVMREQDKMRGKLKETEGAGTKMGQGLEGSFGKVRRSSDQALKGSLRDLRKLGPEGRAMADALRKHFRTTGQAGERSMESVLSELRKIDPEAAKVAASMKGEFKEASNKASDNFSTAATSIKNELRSIIGVFVGTQGLTGAIEKVNQHLTEQRELMQKIKRENITLGQAQETAAKNLAGFDPKERERILNVEIPRIMKETGFASATALTLAAGDIASGGEDDADKLIDALEAGAKTTRQNPDAVGAVASAGNSLRRQIGLADSESAIALLQTTGKAAKIRDPEKVQKTLPVVLNAAAKANPDLDPEILARQTSSLFATATQFAGDQEGDITKSYLLKLLPRMDSFFTGLDEEIINARDRIGTLSKKADPSEKDELELRRLREFIDTAKEVEDPQFPIDRLRLLQNDALERQFVGAGFGEAQFDTFRNQILNKGAGALTQVEATFETIKTDREFFKREAEALQNLTPSLAIGTADARSRASSALGRIANTEEGALSQIRSGTGMALGETKDRGIFGFFDKGADFALGGHLVGDTAAEEAVSAIQLMQQRIDRFARDGVTPGEQIRIDQLEAEIDNTVGLIGSLGMRGALDLEGVREAIELGESRLRGTPVSAGTGAAPTMQMPTDEQAARLNQMIGLLERIADQSSKNREAAEQAAKSANETAQNTRTQPRPATPALSNQQP